MINNIGKAKPSYKLMMTPTLSPHSTGGNNITTMVPGNKDDDFVFGLSKETFIVLACLSSAVILVIIIVIIICCFQCNKRTSGSTQYKVRNNKRQKKLLEIRRLNKEIYSQSDTSYVCNDDNGNMRMIQENDGSINNGEGNEDDCGEERYINPRIFRKRSSKKEQQKSQTKKPLLPKKPPKPLPKPKSKKNKKQSKSSEVDNANYEMVDASLNVGQYEVSPKKDSSVEDEFNYEIMDVDSGKYKPPVRPPKPKPRKDKMKQSSSSEEDITDYETMTGVSVDGGEYKTPNINPTSIDDPGTYVMFKE